MHVRSGFRAVLRQPALVLGEIAWRWGFGVAAWVLVIAALRRILANVDVSEAERLIARRSDAFVIADAGARILAQVLPQFGRACVVLVPAISVLWIAAATLGRGATMQAMLATPAARVPRIRFGALAVLNALRALYTLAAMAAFVGAMLLAGTAMPALDVTVAALTWILLAFVVAFFWSAVNWFLALAPIWIVRDGRSALKSIADSASLFRGEPGEYMAIAWWFGLLRTLAVAAAIVAALVAGAASGSNAAAIAICIAVSLAYFAVADFLYIARLAAYLDLNEVVAPEASPPQPHTAAPTLASPTGS
jgi:hypothetical protein